MGSVLNVVEGARTAVLVDFGGVITSSVLQAFTDFGASLGGDPRLPLDLLSRDQPSRALLADHECGRIDAEAFERGFAERLRAHGAAVQAEGLTARMQAGMSIDQEVLALLGDLRSAGYPVALVSNSFGNGTYDGVDLAAVADAVVISSEVGIRKPSRRIYAIACERLGIAPEEAVMIDDLRQNLDGAARIGIGGVLHTGAADTRRQLAESYGISA
ncbi:HAD family phosphatase [Streptomyces xinghaiensis]|uniref:HAD family phosphatase n=2 Tax=Streptomyces TaxID=1883 RepID=A0A3R7H997_9ACTN|nr:MULTISPECIES: HAD family phosphatase [Streptomyces]KNE83889.1 HAD family hydrolase [Streptomyces fradiae]OFA55767.1 HAD family hydrolase [Streptomyces fradiae]PQM23877.1 HAD family phosphatase [Streptomyces xinghaiensis]RKM92012.1 HAD family phosphatase [Streptomyces xinghaiensis]RNC73569.1 HAD family phosphatase [Streptomyces xinghaiensis]